MDTEGKTTDSSDDDTSQRSDPLGLSSMDPADLEAMFDLTRIQNLRDVGGLPIAPADVVGPAGSAVPSGRASRDTSKGRATDGGIIRRGRVFRSAQLGEQNERTVAQLAELSVDVVFDLRSETEAELLPDFAPTGVELAHRDILADSDERLATLFTNLEDATDALEAGAIHEHYVATYRNLVTLPSAVRGYSDLFSSVAAGRSVLFHCTAGKDRTGWAAASLQLLLGASYEAVSAHYLASNAVTVELFSGVIESLTELGIDADVITPAFMVERMYLDAAIQEVFDRFGTIDRYFSEGLGLDDDALDSIRHHLIDD